MGKIKSIYWMFVVYLVTALAGLFTIGTYGIVNLKQSLMHIADMQLDNSSELLGQKIREIEIEADGIIHSSELENLQREFLKEDYQVYHYVMASNRMGEYLKDRQRTNVGMSEFILYWPKTGHVMSTGPVSLLDRGIFESAKDDGWFVFEKQVYYVRQYKKTGQTDMDMPYMFIQMDSDFLYKIKSMAFDITPGGGALLASPEGVSLFSVNSVEENCMQRFPKGKRGRETGFTRCAWAVKNIRSWNPGHFQTG